MATLYYASIMTFNFFPFFQGNKLTTTKAQTPAEVSLLENEIFLVEKLKVLFNLNCQFKRFLKMLSYCT